MLSFLRSKSSDVSVNEIVDGTNKLHFNQNNNDSTSQMTGSQSNQPIQNRPENLIKSLGYQNANDLKETIYGELM